MAQLAHEACMYTTPAIRLRLALEKLKVIRLQHLGPSVITSRRRNDSYFKGLLRLRLAVVS
jgi:hypothetical protein